MQNDANYALVGVLATAIIAAFFAFVFWFAGPSSNVTTRLYNVVFTGSVSGISTGTEVQFNGIRVGQVNSVGLDPEDSNRVVAQIEVADTTPVRADTKTLMGFQGLTGSGSVQLSGGTPEAGELVPEAGDTIPTLYAETSDFQSILDGLTGTINGASTAVDRLNGFLDENDGRLNATVANVESFTAALASNSDGVETFMASIADVGADIGPMAAEIRSLSTDLRGLINAIPREDVTQAVADITTFTNSLARNSTRIDTFFDTTNTLATNLTELSDGLKSSVAVLDQIAGQVDPEVVGRVLGNVDTFTATLGENSENFDTILGNVTALTSSINGSVARFDEILVTVNDTIATDIATFTESLARNSGRIDGLFDTATAVAGSITEMSDGLKASVAVVQEAASQIDPEVVARVIGNVDQFAATLGANTENIETIVGNATTFSASLNGSVDQFNTLLANVNETVTTDIATFTESLARNSGRIDGFFETVTTLSANLTELSNGLKSSVAVIDQVTAQIDPAIVGRVLGNVDEFANKLGENSGSIDTIVANVNSLTTSLNGSAARVDEILATINDTVAGADSDGLFDEIANAAISVRNLADQLNASTTNIAGGLNDFTNRGLSQYTSLAVDARGVLERLDRVVRGFEANPQSLIFGGDTVRDYNKQ